MIIIDPTNSQRHAAFLSRQLSISSKAASWFALTAVRADYPIVPSNWSYTYSPQYGGNSSFLWTQQAFTYCADSE